MVINMGKITKVMILAVILLQLSGIVLASERFGFDPNKTVVVKIEKKVHIYKDGKELEAFRKKKIFKNQKISFMPISGSLCLSQDNQCVFTSSNNRVKLTSLESNRIMSQKMGQLLQNEQPQQFWAIFPVNSSHFYVCAIDKVSFKGEDHVLSMRPAEVVTIDLDNPDTTPWITENDVPATKLPVKIENSYFVHDECYQDTDPLCDISAKLIFHDEYSSKFVFSYKGKEIHVSCFNVLLWEMIEDKDITKPILFFIRSRVDEASMMVKVVPEKNVLLSCPAKEIKREEKPVSFIACHKNILGMSAFALLAAAVYYFDLFAVFYA